MTKTVICKDVFGNEYKTPIDDLDVRIGVYAVIIRDNKILLARQWEGYSIIYATPVAKATAPPENTLFGLKKKFGGGNLKK